MPNRVIAQTSWWERYPSWVIGIALIAFYPITYFWINQFAYSNWLINSGIYFSLMWFAPRRLWPWLIVAYMVARATPGQFNHFFFPERFTVDYGVLAWRWVLENPAVHLLGVMGDPILLLSGVVYLRSREVTPATIGSPAGMTQLHVAAMISALATAAKDAVYVLVVGDPLLPHVLRVILGHFIAIMLVAPMAALIFVPEFRKGAASTWRETLLYVLPYTFIVLLLAQIAKEPETAEILRRMLLIAVVIMAIRHGWRGAVVALLISSVALQIEARLFHELKQTVVVQAFVSVAGVMGLMFGAARDAVIERSERLEKLLIHNEELTADLASAALSAQQTEIRERNQVAMELHDEFGQNLTALQLYMHQLPDRTVHADTMLSIVGNMRMQIQRVLETLRPAALEELGLYAAIERGSIARTAQVAGLKMTTELRGDVQLLKQLDDIYQLTAYRVIQEAVTNIIRHANATECRVRISVYERSGCICLFLSVVDDGIGRVHHLSSGHALTNLKQRITSIGGQWRWHNLPVGLRLNVLLRQDILQPN